MLAGRAGPRAPLRAPRVLAAGDSGRQRGRPPSGEAGARIGRDLARTGSATPTPPARADRHRSPSKLHVSLATGTSTPAAATTSEVRVCAGKVLDTAEECPLDAGGHRNRLVERLAPVELLRRQRGRELDERERVARAQAPRACGLRPTRSRARGVARAARATASSVSGHDRACRQLREIELARLPVAHGGDDRELDPRHPATDESDRIRGLAVEPVSVVERDQERALVGDVVEQASAFRPTSRADPARRHPPARAQRPGRAAGVPAGRPFRSSTGCSSAWSAA